MCGYVYEGENPPAECPVCHAKADKFAEVKESADGPQYAAEHVLGVAKGCDPEVWAGLEDHFKGECSEVGMYLAMSRQAIKFFSLRLYQPIKHIDKPITFYFVDLIINTFALLAESLLSSVFTIFSCAPLQISLTSY